MEISKEEKINRMKLCTLCVSDEENPYLEIDAKLHERDFMHKTLAKTWAPLKGHPLFEQHNRAVRLLA